MASSFGADEDAAQPAGCDAELRRAGSARQMGAGPSIVTSTGRHCRAAGVHMCAKARLTAHLTLGTADQIGPGSAAACTCTRHYPWTKEGI
jgi:hypothetical protein